MTELPNLPKQIKRREASFGISFRAWLKSNHSHFQSCSFELKQTEKNSFPFESVEPAQVVFSNMIESKSEGVLIRVQGLNGEPDYVFLKKEKSYIVIKYPECFVVIDHNDFIFERDRSTRKSLTSERALEICKYNG